MLEGLERQTGGVSRDIERGSRSIQSLLNYTIYNILPTLVEIAMVIVLLSAKFDGWFAAITFGALVLYILFTVSVTEWRTAFRRAMNEHDSKANTKALDALLNYETVKYFSNEPFEHARYDIWFIGITLAALVLYIIYTVTITEWRTGFRRQMNELDSKANTRAIDSLLNYETVKYFNNEEFEARRYDESLQRWEEAAVKSQTSLSLLNIGQSAIIAVAVTLIMWRATLGVVERTMTIGDLVLVNAFMIQLYIPLNFLGVIYREIKQALADMERMFHLIEVNAEISDAPGAPPLTAGGGEVRFEHVDFHYEANRQILFDVSFVIPAGRTIAVVGPSGSGKSTLARLLYRFYDVSSGRITIDGQDLRSVQQTSVRAAIGIVPQDTVLFNDSIEYNIAYGNPGATHEQIVIAARLAQIHDFVSTLPEGYRTPVGERGLKLSGGEKQRVAIARAILKDPRILIFDEATSALDSKSEKLIQAELEEISAGCTTLTVAHRLSTIVGADQILVLEHGRITERGTHAELLAAGGSYARMWALQQQRREGAEDGSPDPRNPSAQVIA